MNHARIFTCIRGIPRPGCLCLHTKAKSANMSRMKIFWSCIATTLGLMMVSCSSVVQQMDFIPVPGEEEATDETSGDEASAEESAEEEATEGEDEEQPKPRKTKEKAQQESTAAATSSSDVSDLVPTPEQQAAAAKLLATKSREASATTHDVLPEPVAQEEVLVDAIPNTSGIPGRNSLRMHRYAPPEEAASAGEAKALTPNRAERHGFRSPVLPTKLPMDINGKLTGEGNN